VGTASWAKAAKTFGGSKSFLKSLLVAQTDVEAAFREFLTNHCTEGRPFVLAGHAQGGHHILHLMKHILDKDPALRGRLVCAYVAGALAGNDTFEHIPVAECENDCRCFVSWLTTSAEKNTSIPPRNDGGGSARASGTTFTTTPISVNPLLWTTTDEEAPPRHHMGCMDMQGNMTGYMVGCRAANEESDSKSARGGCLLISGDVPKGYVSDTSEPHDYHKGDFPCFWMNLRHNVHKRLQTWLREQLECK